MSGKGPVKKEPDEPHIIYLVLYNMITEQAYVEEINPSNLYMPGGQEVTFGLGGHIVKLLETGSITEAVQTRLKANTTWLEQLKGTYNFGQFLLHKNKIQKAMKKLEMKTITKNLRELSDKLNHSLPDGVELPSNVRVIQSPFGAVMVQMPE
jgi:hypothetical protein